MSARKFRIGDTVRILYPDYLAGLRGEVIGLRRPNGAGNLLYNVRVCCDGKTHVIPFRANRLTRCAPSSLNPAQAVKRVEQPKTSGVSWITDASQQAMKSII